jgi:hypothetical protein
MSYEHRIAKHRRPPNWWLGSTKYTANYELTVSDDWQAMLS